METYADALAAKLQTLIEEIEYIITLCEVAKSEDEISEILEELSSQSGVIDSIIKEGA